MTPDPFDKELFTDQTRLQSAIWFTTSSAYSNKQTNKQTSAWEALRKNSIGNFGKTLFVEKTDIGKSRLFN